ncbi:MAG: ferritin family protein [Candidatus Aminicenantes bacterium]|nr:MAG: ferritin family protein [Candidatus Aminicenantes bacterium]
MTETNAIDILKGAILLEYRGKALYDSAVKTSKSESVKELFSMLSSEEDKHIHVLEKQFSRVSKGESFDIAELEKDHASTHETILTQEIVKSISGAGYEAAVIAAALDFEKNAVKFYSERASSAESDQEKKLYLWLTEWEKNHMLMMARLDNELKEKIWYDNRFWPLD